MTEEYLGAWKRQCANLDSVISEVKMVMKNKLELKKLKLEWNVVAMKTEKSHCVVLYTNNLQRWFQVFPSNNNKYQINLFNP